MRDFNEKIDLNIEDIEFAGTGKGVQRIFDKTTGEYIESDFDMSPDDIDLENDIDYINLRKQPEVFDDFLSPEDEARLESFGDSRYGSVDLDSKPNLETTDEDLDNINQTVQSSNEESDVQYYERFINDLNDELNEWEESLSNLLNKHGFNGEIIERKDGTLVSINDLTPKEKIQVLDELLESYYEIGYVDPVLSELQQYIDESGLTVDEVIDKLAQIKASEIVENSEDVSILDLPDDEVYKYHLLTLNPDMSELELEQRLFDAKKYPSFQNEVDRLREMYYAQEQELVTQEKLRELEELNESLELARKNFVEEIEPISSIDGFKISDRIKNYLLNDLLELDSDGLSPFMRRIMSSPTLAFKLAFYDNYSDEINNIIESKIQEAFEAGRMSVLNKLRHSNEPSYSYVKESQPRQIYNNSTHNYESVEDLWN